MSFLIVLEGVKIFRHLLVGARVMLSIESAPSTVRAAAPILWRPYPRRFAVERGVSLFITHDRFATVLRQYPAVALQFWPSCGRGYGTCRPSISDYFLFSHPLLARLL